MRLTPRDGCILAHAYIWYLTQYFTGIRILSPDTIKTEYLHHLSTLFVLSRLDVFIHRHWGITFVSYLRILYLSYRNRHQDLMVHPKWDSLRVCPLGIASSELYSVSAIHRWTPLTPPLLLSSPSWEVHICFHLASPGPAFWDTSIKMSTAILVGID